MKIVFVILTGLLAIACFVVAAMAFSAAHWGGLIPLLMGFGLIAWVIADLYKMTKA